MAGIIARPVTPEWLWNFENDELQPYYDYHRIDHRLGEFSLGIGYASALEYYKYRNQ